MGGSPASTEGVSGAISGPQLDHVEEVCLARAALRTFEGLIPRIQWRCGPANLAHPDAADASIITSLGARHLEIALSDAEVATRRKDASRRTLPRFDGGSAHASRSETGAVDTRDRLEKPARVRM